MDRFPIQGGPSIPWSVAEIAYAEYARRYGRSQSLQRLAERGGFYVNEMDEYHPRWREEVGEIARLTRERDETCERLLHPKRKGSP